MLFVKLLNVVRHVGVHYFGVTNWFVQISVSSYVEKVNVICSKEWQDRSQRSFNFKACARAKLNHIKYCGGPYYYFTFFHATCQRLLSPSGLISNMSFSVPDLA